MHAIEEAAHRRALLVFDFDGTLAPIVLDRAAAALRDSTRALLRKAALVYPTAVVSGRSRSDVAARVAHAPLVAVVGNHGGEPGHEGPDPRVRRRVEAWAAALARALADLGGVEVEDKGITLTVHYRRSRRPESARRRIVEAASALEGARVSGGHAVVNVCPAGMPRKGAAVEKLVARFAAPMAVYVGDDVTDEDAFESPAVAVSIRVGRSRDSSARYYLDEQADLDALLDALIAARESAAQVES